MKKIKLISSLSTLGVVAAATPIVATSCSTFGNMKDITVYFHEKSWTKPPQVGVTSQLVFDTLTYSIPDIDFSATPINIETIWANVKTMVTFGVGVTFAPLHLTITPLLPGEQNFNFRFTCFKDNTEKENGITYNVSGTINVLPPEQK